MDIKKDFEDVKDAAKKGIDDIRDAAHEAEHRSTADAERARRELDGDNMTAGEKLGSAINEGKNRTQAEIDAAKRSARDST